MFSTDLHTDQKGESLTDSKKIPSITRPEEARESSVSRAVTNGNTASPSTSCQGQVPDPGHNRNNSSTSEMSKVSGYHSLGGAAHGHSRNSSYENNSLKKLEHKRLVYTCIGVIWGAEHILGGVIWRGLYLGCFI